MGGSSRSKTANKGSRPRGSKRKAVELLEDPMDEDTPATACDVGDPPADPISSHHPRAPPLKRIHLADDAQANPIKFVPPAMKGMSPSQPCTSSPSSTRILILNDYLPTMLDYKSKHNKFPSSYDDMVAFLSEVHILVISNLIRLAIHKFIIHGGDISEIRLFVGGQVWLVCQGSECDGEWQIVHAYK